MSAIAKLTPEFGAFKLERGPDANSEQAQISRAAAMLEGVFLRQMLKVMRATVPEGTLLGDSSGQKLYTEMFDGAMADEMAQSGGIGLREVLVDQLGGIGQGSAALPLRTISPQRAAQRFQQMAAAGMAIAQPAGLSLASGVAPSPQPAAQSLDPPPALPSQSQAPRLESLAPDQPVRSAVVADAGQPLGGLLFEAPHRPEPVQLQDADGRLRWPTAEPVAWLDSSGTLSAPQGAEILASGSGTVVAADGASLVVDHGNGLTSRYVGLGKVQAQKGDLVLRGQTIGHAGEQNAIQFAIHKQGRMLQPAEFEGLFDGS